MNVLTLIAFWKLLHGYVDANEGIKSLDIVKSFMIILIMWTEAYILESTIKDFQAVYKGW